MTIFASEERLQPYLDIGDDGLMRLHSVEYEDAIEALLYRLGRLEHPHNDLPVAGLYHFQKAAREVEKGPMDVGPIQPMDERRNCCVRRRR
jgi:hypothetical protein